MVPKSRKRGRADVLVVWLVVVLGRWCDDVWDVESHHRQGEEDQDHHH